MKPNYKKSILASLSFFGLSNVISAQSIAAGGWHSVAICNDSTVKAFGENATGELGDGTTVDKSTPVAVSGLTGIVAVSAGGDQLEAHSMALKKNGTVWAWGSNIYGGLGNGSTNNATTPVQSLNLTNIIAISAGGWHSVALKNDGTVWTWGWNTDGQLGDGTTTDKAVPAQVPGLTGITNISAGTYHVLALKNDGTVWAWGDNVSGQIGDGTLVDKKTPVQVSGLTGVVKIATGRFFSLAVKSDGTVWTWGENLYGQLGNGTVVNSSIPVQVNVLSTNATTVVATGAFHCMVVKNDGTIWSWGRNTYGNLGDGTLTHQSNPVQMTGITSAIGMAAGTNFSLLFKNDGTFWGCGRNLSGQLGDGTFLQRNTVVQATALCSVFHVVGIKEQADLAGSRTTVYPNPSSDGNFTLKMHDGLFINSMGYEIKIYNALGEELCDSGHDFQIKDESVTINLAEQPNGIYFLNMKYDGKIVYKKLIKQ